MPKTVSPMKPTSCCNWVEGGVSHGLCPGTTSRGSPTLASAALSITLLKPILLVICLCGSSWGPNPLDEEAAVKSAIGRSSLTSGFTIWSSTGCELVAFEYCRDFRDESLRVFPLVPWHHQAVGPRRLTLAFPHHLS